MLKSLEINNFRGHRHLKMIGLQSVNLLVGLNNSGKTSVLEAIELLVSQGSFESIWQMSSRRGDRIVVQEPGSRYAESDLSQLFYGRELDLGTGISVSATTDHGTDSIMLSLVTKNEPSLFSSSEENGDDEDSSVSIGVVDSVELCVSWTGDGKTGEYRIPISRRGGISSRLVGRQIVSRDRSPVNFVSTAALPVEEVMTLFDEVVLTDEENLLVEVLQFIEPAIERIASVASDRSRLSSRSSRGGIVVKLKGSRRRIPIGSMGDGIWRLMGIALALVNSKDGVLLIDEVDTGLHYTVLSDLWHLVAKTSERLNVQVFATTHSRDCYESLASIITDGDFQPRATASIQRIDAEGGGTTAFSEAEIVAAAERGIEVR